MENAGGGGGREHGKVGSSSSSGLSWDIWSVGNWGTTTTTTTSTHLPDPLSTSSPSSFHPYQNITTPFQTITTAHHEPSHHLTCLKLGKRQYYEEGHEGSKKERSILMIGSSSFATGGVAAAVIPRCQVEGCNVSLMDSKDYHKRHKVCEVHSKSPKVVVHGLEQRFCQQCSRFHVMSEFDDTKRSCRRRLAGHNERRRKGSNDSIIRNPSNGNTVVCGGRYAYSSSTSSSSTSPGRALSLLSGSASQWASPDISLRSSAALRELIAENRAAHLSRQLFVNQHSSMSEFPNHQIHVSAGQEGFPNAWHHFHENNRSVTLDLMQVPGSSPVQFLSRRTSRSDDKEADEQECCEIWRSLEETHVV